MWISYSHRIVYLFTGDNDNVAQMLVCQKAILTEVNCMNAAGFFNIMESTAAKHLYLKPIIRQMSYVCLVMPL